MNKQIKNLIITLTLGSLCAPTASLYAMNNTNRDNSTPPYERDEDEKYSADNDEEVDGADSKWALYRAIDHNDIPKVTQLLDSGVPVNTLFGETNETPLIFAASKGHHEIIILLLARGADMSAQTTYRNTALHAALSEGHLRAIQALLYHEGAETHILDILYPVDNLDTSMVWDIDGLLEEAAKQGYADIAKLLYTKITQLLSRAAELPESDKLISDLTWAQTNALTSAMNHQQLETANILMDILFPSANITEHSIKQIKNSLWGAAYDGNDVLTTLLLNKVTALRNTIVHNIPDGPEKDSLQSNLDEAVNSAFRTAREYNHPSTMHIIFDYLYSSQNADIAMLKKIASKLNHAAWNGDNILTELLLEKIASLQPAIDALSEEDEKEASEIHCIRHCRGCALSSASKQQHFDTAQIILDAIYQTDKLNKPMLESMCSEFALAIDANNTTLITMLMNKVAQLRDAIQLLPDGEDKDALKLAHSITGANVIIKAIESGNQDTALSLLQTVHKNVYTYSEDNDTTPQGAFTLSEQDAIRVQHEAARHPGTERIIDLLQTHAIGIIDARGADGRTALMIAAEHGHESVVNFLIQLSGENSLGLANYAGDTPLILASRAGKAENAAVLLHHMLRCEDKNEAINHLNTHNKTALLEAIANEHEQVAKLLLKPATLAEEVAYNQYKLEHGAKALVCSAAEGFISLVEALVECGVSIDATSTFGGMEFTPLTMASMFSRHNTMKTLLALGADVNKKHIFGSSTLEVVNGANNRLTTQILIHAGANINHENDHGSTALSGAVIYGTRHVVTALLEAKASVDIPDKNGKTALQHAIDKAQGLDILALSGLPMQYQDPDPQAFVGLLVKAGANPHLPNPITHETPWETATPEIQALMTEAMQEREASLFNARTLAQQSVVPPQIAQHIFGFARGVPAQKITKVLRAAHSITNDYESKEDDEEVKSAIATQSSEDAHATCCVSSPNCGKTICQNTYVCKSCGTGGQKGRALCKNEDCAKQLSIRCTTCAAVNTETNTLCKMCSLALHTNPQPVIVNSTDGTIFENNAHMNHDGELALDWSN